MAEEDIVFYAKFIYELMYDRDPTRPYQEYIFLAHKKSAYPIQQVARSFFVDKM